MNQPEVWMRGPVSGIPALLQPVAHSLLQSREEIEKIINGFDDHLLWLKPGGAASVGFHLEHISGVIDRLFTYARGNQLNDIQLALLAEEGKEKASAASARLIHQISVAIDLALIQLAATDEIELTEDRALGRKKIPTTSIGLLFHAAEHVQRHVGQLLVTVQWVASLR